MSNSNTGTKTFTVADIRKVVENFAADYSMIGQSTGLRTRTQVERDVADLQAFAEDGCLVSVRVMLKDAAGNKVNAAVYRPNTNAAGWTSDRPGNALWPETLGGSLYITATLSDAWWEKSETQKANYVAARGLHSGWGRTTVDTSVAGMSSSSGQRYASNGYGWERTNYSN